MCTLDERSVSKPYKPAAVFIQGTTGCPIINSKASRRPRTSGTFNAYTPCQTSANRPVFTCPASCLRVITVNSSPVVADLEPSNLCKSMTATVAARHVRPPEIRINVWMQKHVCIAPAVQPPDAKAPDTPCVRGPLHLLAEALVAEER